MSQYLPELAGLTADINHLAERFSQSAPYRDFQHYKKLLEEDPVLLTRVKEYKKAQTEFEYKRLRGESMVNFDEEKHVSNLYTELSLNKVAGAFLAAENALLELYRQAFDTLCDACDLDL